MSRQELDKRLALEVAERVGARGVIVLAFGPPKSGDQTSGLAVWAGYGAPGSRVHDRLGDLADELAGEIERGLFDTELLGAALRAEALARADRAATPPAEPAPARGDPAKIAGVYTDLHELRLGGRLVGYQAFWGFAARYLHPRDLRDHQDPEVWLDEGRWRELVGASPDLYERRPAARIEV